MWKSGIIILLSLALIMYSCSDRERIVDQRILSNYDFRQFQGTPAWELAKAVEDGETEKIEIILRENPGLANFQSPKYGLTVLHLAVSHCNRKSVESLLKSNIDVNIRGTEKGDTPLNEACFNNDIELVKLLIEYGADINVKEISDSSHMPRSPLMSACFVGFEDAAKLLISKGADINYIMNGDYTALGESLMVGHYKIAYFLLLHGADYKIPIMRIKKYSKTGKDDVIRSVYIKEEIEEKNINYLTPERKYYYKIVDFLKEKGIDIKESSEREFHLTEFVKQIIQYI